MKSRVAIAVAAVLLAGCTAVKENEPASPALAKVNDATVTASRLKDKLKLLNVSFSNRSAGTGSGTDAKMDLLSQLIEEEIYLQEARRLNIYTSEAEVEARLRKDMADYPGDGFNKVLELDDMDMDGYRDELARKLTVEKLIQSEVYSKVKVDSAQVRNYYDAHRKDFERPAMVRARQIVVDNEDEASEILDRLRKGADFAYLAKARSLSPDSAAGGDLGPFSRGDMPPEFEAVVFKMRPGETSGVVKTPYGYHIFKVDEVIAARKPSFSEAEAEARKKLVLALGEDAFERWRQGLRSGARVEVNFEVLSRL